MNRPIVVVVGFGVVIIFAILWLRPLTDPAIVITLTAGFVMQILNFISSRENNAINKETNKAVNGQAAINVETAKKLGVKIGEDIGRGKANAETAALADQLYTRENPPTDVQE